ncbi:DUF2971 domain-containing protein [Octadecabacter ascidiaceicola]|uniref:DUF2971 domain-containing protein n=1 Tax=Octadecabacter ascidiaceicola TaxID=1655543 RepID=A0A238JTH0_9RHOB|nr:DUF2971 domain-containing protein [Octadecabacter ascidiaceicola]SMX33487.1 hypothetical protein OCA8868_00963 [Octadecabacter ascidiaceicola]
MSDESEKLAASLFRYRSSNTKHFFEELSKAILNSSIFLSSAASLNDPMDFRPYYDELSLPDFVRMFKEPNRRSRLMSRERFNEISGRNLSRGEFRKLPGNKLKAVNSASVKRKILRTMASEFPHHTRVACFSEAESSIPMWAHYTDNHRGICLKYRLDWAQNDLPEKADIFPLKVQYVDERPILTTEEWNNFSDRSDYETGNFGNSDILSKICLHKSEEWSYEREWRVFVNDNSKPKYWYAPRLTPVSLRLGLNIGEETKREILARFSSKIEILQAVLSPRDFSLMYSPV